MDYFRPAFLKLFEVRSDDCCTTGVLNVSHETFLLIREAVGPDLDLDGDEAPFVAGEYVRHSLLRGGSEVHAFGIEHSDGGGAPCIAAGSVDVVDDLIG